jgi:hypothetical protein
MGSIEKVEKVPFFIAHLLKHIVTSMEEFIKNKVVMDSGPIFRGMTFLGGNDSSNRVFYDFIKKIDAC